MPVMFGQDDLAQKARLLSERHGREWKLPRSEMLYRQAHGEVAALLLGDALLSIDLVDITAPHGGAHPKYAIVAVSKERVVRSIIDVDAFHTATNAYPWRALDRMGVVVEESGGPMRVIRVDLHFGDAEIRVTDKNTEVPEKVVAAARKALAA